MRKRRILTHADAIRRAFLEHVGDAPRSAGNHVPPRLDIVAAAEPVALPKLDLAVGRCDGFFNVAARAQVRRNPLVRGKPAVIAFFLLSASDASGLETIGRHDGCPLNLQI